MRSLRWTRIACSCPNFLMEHEQTTVRETVFCRTSCLQIDSFSLSCGYRVCSALLVLFTFYCYEGSAQCTWGKVLNSMKTQFFSPLTRGFCELNRVTVTGFDDERSNHISFQGQRVSLVLLTLIIPTCWILTINLRHAKKQLTSVLWRISSWSVCVFSNLFHVIVSQTLWISLCN